MTPPDFEERARGIVKCAESVFKTYESQLFAMDHYRLALYGGIGQALADAYDEGRRSPPLPNPTVFMLANKSMQTFYATREAAEKRIAQLGGNTASGWWITEFSVAGSPALDTPSKPKEPWPARDGLLDAVEKIMDPHEVDEDTLNACHEALTSFARPRTALSVEEIEKAAMEQKPDYFDMCVEVMQETGRAIDQKSLQHMQGLLDATYQLGARNAARFARAKLSGEG